MGKRVLGAWGALGSLSARIGIHIAECARGASPVLAGNAAAQGKGG